MRAWLGLDDKFIAGGLILAVFLTFLSGVALSSVSDLPNSVILYWQIASALLYTSSALFIRKAGFKLVLLYIFLYQVFLSVILQGILFSISGNVFGGEAIDARLYSKIAQVTYDMPFVDKVRYINQFLRDLSDMGFPIFLGYIYAICDGDVSASMNLLLVVNILSQLGTVCLIYQITKYLDLKKSQSMWVVVLWGLNILSVYLNVSGLKEPVFLLICTAVMYMIYRVKRSGAILDHILLIALIALTWFFRYYMSLFYIIIYVGYCGFPKLYSRYFALMCISAIVVSLFMLDMLGLYMPELRTLSVGSEAFYQGKGIVFKIVTNIITFMGPIPRFFSMKYFADISIIGFSLVKYFLSIFAFIAAYRVVRQGDDRYYPLISIYLFTSLMMIASNHMIDYRYAYVMLPCMYILMIVGANKPNKMVLGAYTFIAVLLMLMFNMKIY